MDARIATISLLLLSTPLTGYAVDLGVRGHIYPNKDLDMREFLQEKLKTLDRRKINSEIKAAASNLGENLEDFGLQIANETRTVYQDPSIVLKDDIWAPIEQADGSWEWKMMYAKGYKVNPLERGMRPTQAMLFIDGNAPDQVDLAVDALKTNPLQIRVVLTAGNPIALGKELQTPIYYADAFLLSRFRVKLTPSLLTLGKGSHENHLALTSFARPYAVTNLVEFLQ